MNSPNGHSPKPQPPDWQQRQRALDPTRSFLVQAPAGSGKTYLLTQRFLRLLALAEKPESVVAITFTNAAAAEMLHRILNALETAQRSHESHPPIPADPESIEALAASAMERSRLLGWEILDQPSQLRVTTIDSFCRSIALQSPLGWGALSGLGGNLDTVKNAKELYRKAARRTLEVLDSGESETRKAVEEILLWRDNNWQDVESLIVEMLGSRNRWRQEFVFARNNDWTALREKLERPFRRAAQRQLDKLAERLDALPEFHSFALSQARIACETPGKSSPLSLAERAELPRQWRHKDADTHKQLLEDAIDAYRCLADFLLTNHGTWRKKGGITAANGFPTTNRAAKERFVEFLESLQDVEYLESTLGAFQKPLPVGYTEDEWQLIQHCFTLLRHAAGQLLLVFAETGTVDFTEIAQIALNLLTPEDGIPSEVAIRQAESIHHLLIDEFQDTSRNQHQLLAYLIGAWPEREGRTCFCVGDPMQSIYSFREAEVELFEHLRTHGFVMEEILDTPPFHLDALSLTANFRTAPSLVEDLNGHFEQIFAIDDGSGIAFSRAEATRENLTSAKVELHLAFTFSSLSSRPDESYSDCLAEATRKLQTDATVALIRDKLQAAQTQVISSGQPGKFRIAVLGKTRSALLPIALALQEAGVPFRAVELVKLRERAEVLDALSLMRALLNPVDRTAWLGLLRAPWCGLTLAELHLLTSADDRAISTQPVPELLATRLPALHRQGQFEERSFRAADRVRLVMATAVNGRGSSGESGTQLLGTRIEALWKALGGDHTVSPVQRENLRLLWAALDSLPEGELDLLGAGLNAALEDLYALPDPAASTEFGVQLMTIHKSKGLEFEIVILPDLEASPRNSETSMISWLERGLQRGLEQSLSPSKHDQDLQDDADLTEFLIAPIQAKGTDRGQAKQWVDGIRRAREKQEMRRLLYVGATRAREELHLFARPQFSLGKTDSLPSLANSKGLLATAWPALGEAITAQFASWCGERTQASAGSSNVAEIAAGADAGNLIVMPNPTPTPASSTAPARLTILRRLPADYDAPLANPESYSLHAASQPPGPVKPATGEQIGGEQMGDEQTGDEPSRDAQSRDARALFTRTEGGLESRLLGTAIHSLLERLAQLREASTPHEAAEDLAASLPAVVARMRGQGLTKSAAQQLAAEALAVARQASIDPIGAWILAPHPHAASESRWTGLISSRTTHTRWNVRPDRVFLASMFNTSESPTWWIIDFKSGIAPDSALVSPSAKEAFALAHRDRYRPQLEAYAQVLRQLRHAEAELEIPIRAGIYYPRLQWLDHFEVSFDVVSHASGAALS